MENITTFYIHLVYVVCSHFVHVMAIWYILCYLVYFSLFGMLYKEKIWQTCYEPNNTI
jgi:hypothetical protein